MDAFAMIDADQSGTIDSSELMMIFEQLGITATAMDIRLIMDVADVDGNGELDFDEFLAAVMGFARDKGVDQEKSTAALGKLKSAADELVLLTKWKDKAIPMNMRGAKGGGAKTLGTLELGGTHNCTLSGKSIPKYYGTDALEKVGGPPVDRDWNYIPPRIDAQIALRGGYSSVRKVRIDKARMENMQKMARDMQDFEDRSRPPRWLYSVCSAMMIGESCVFQTLFESLSVPTSPPHPTVPCPEAEHSNCT